MWSQNCHLQRSNINKYLHHRKNRHKTLHIITKERERALKGIFKEAAEQKEIIKTVPLLAEIGNSVARIAQFLNNVRCCKWLANKGQNLLVDTSCICHLWKQLAGQAIYLLLHVRDM